MAQNSLYKSIMYCNNDFVSRYWEHEKYVLEMAFTGLLVWN